MSSGTTGLVSGALLPKDAVNYRPLEKCAMCTFFYAPNSCTLVQGPIAPEAVCNKYALRPPAQPIDGAFYIEQFQKSVAGTGR